MGRRKQPRPTKEDVLDKLRAAGLQVSEEQLQQLSWVKELDDELDAKLATVRHRAERLAKLHAAIEELGGDPVLVGRQGDSALERGTLEYATAVLLGRMRKTARMIDGLYAHYATGVIALHESTRLPFGTRTVGGLTVLLRRHLKFKEIAVLAAAYGWTTTYLPESGERYDDQIDRITDALRSLHRFTVEQAKKRKSRAR